MLSFSEFFEKFDEAAAAAEAGGELSRAEVVRIASEISVNNATKCIQVLTSETVMENIRLQLAILPFPVDTSILDDLSMSFFSAIRSLVRGGAVKKLTEKFVTLVDLDDNGTLNHTEMFGLYESFLKIFSAWKALSESPSEGCPAFLEASREFLTLILHFFDGNNDVMLMLFIPYSRVVLVYTLILRLTLNFTCRQGNYRFS